MARPGGLELPTFWFVVESREILNALFGVAYPKTIRFSVPQLGNLGNQKGITMTKKLKPSELDAAAQRLIREGKMPTLEELLAVIANVREKYHDQILATRQEPMVR